MDRENIRGRMKIPSLVRIKDEFATQGSIMVMAMGVVNLCSLLFHLFMVRNLATIDYGILNSLLAMFMIISVPTATIQTVIAKFVSHFQAQGDIEKTKFLIKHLGVRIFISACILFLVIVITRGFLTDFLRLPGNHLVVLLGVSLMVVIIVTVFLGGLQGLQEFGFMGSNMVISNGLKLILGFILILLGFRVVGALIAILVAVAVQLLLAFISLRRSLYLRLKVIASQIKANRNVSSINLTQIYNFFFPVALAHFCFMILTNSDVLLVKHFFSPTDAGDYSVASMVGKMILFLPGAIGIVMFPKTAKLHAEQKSPTAFLNKSLFYSGSLCVAVGLVFIIFPRILVMLLSIDKVDVFIPLARVFVIAMTFFAFLYIIMLYNISIHNLIFLYALVLSVLAQVVLVWFFHDSLLQVLSIVAVNACLLFAVNLWMVKWEPKEKQAK